MIAKVLINKTLRNPAYFARHKNKISRTNPLRSQRLDLETEPPAANCQPHTVKLQTAYIHRIPNPLQQHHIFNMMRMGEHIYRLNLRNLVIVTEQ